MLGMGQSKTIHVVFFGGISIFALIDQVVQVGIQMLDLLAELSNMSCGVFSVVRRITIALASSVVVLLCNLVKHADLTVELFYRLALKSLSLLCFFFNSSILIIRIHRIADKIFLRLVLYLWRFGVEVKQRRIFLWTFLALREVICIFICNFTHGFKLGFWWTLFIINLLLYLVSIFFGEQCRFLNRGCRVQFRDCFSFLLNLLVVKQCSS